MDATDGTWGRAPAAVWRRTARGVVVLRPGGDDAVLLDGTAAELWELLEPPISASELAARLATRYGAPTDQVLTDVGPTLLELQATGVARRMAGP